MTTPKPIERLDEPVRVRVNTILEKMIAKPADQPTTWVEMLDEMEAYITEREREARIDELGKLMPPVADMIPEWEWPCYICGSDRDLLKKYIDDRIASLSTQEEEVE
jgi:hypothetical protein